ncbi:MAG: cell division protein FtsA [Succinivibrio sp.]|nr:cell division protein FtsA [Succinivibrio sp.]
MPEGSRVFKIFGNDDKRQKPQGAQGAAAGDVIFALDIGSSKIRLCAGQVDDRGSVTVLGYLEEYSHGVGHGAVTDIGELSHVLTGMVDRFINAYNFNLRSCVVGVPGCFIESCNEQGSSTVQNSIVTEADKERAIENARAAVHFSESDFDIIHTIQQNYITETSDEVQNPVGQYAKRLQVSVHVIGLRRAHEINVRNVLSQLGADFRASSFVYSGIAAADSVLTEGEKEIGVCLIDIGGGTVNVAVYDNKRLKLSFGLDDGGNTITASIARTFGLPMSVAEELKIKFGSADPRYLTEEEINTAVSYPGEPGNEGSRRDISTQVLAQVIYNNLTNIFRLVQDRIQEFVNTTPERSINLAAGFVLTGGVAMTRNIDKVLLNVNAAQPFSGYQQGQSSVKIRVGSSRGLAGMGQPEIQKMAAPDRAVCVGLLRQGYSQRLRQMTEQSAREEKEGGFRSIMSRISNWAKSEL